MRSQKFICALLMCICLVLEHPAMAGARRRRPKHRKPVFVPYLFSLFSKNGDFKLNREKSTLAPDRSSADYTTPTGTLNTTSLSRVKTLSPNDVSTKSNLSRDSVILSNSTLLSVIFLRNSSLSNNIPTTFPVTTTSYVTTEEDRKSNRSATFIEDEVSLKMRSKDMSDVQNTTEKPSDAITKLNDRNEKDSEIFTSVQQTTIQSTSEPKEREQILTTLNDEKLKNDDDDDNLVLKSSVQNVTKSFDKSYKLTTNSVTEQNKTETATTLSTPTTIAQETVLTTKSVLATKSVLTTNLEISMTKGKLYATTIAPFLDVKGIRILRTKLNENDLVIQNANDEGVQGYRAGYLWNRWTRKWWRSRGK